MYRNGKRRSQVSISGPYGGGAIWKFEMLSTNPKCSNDHIYNFQASKIQILEQLKKHLTSISFGGLLVGIDEYALDRDGWSAPTRFNSEFTN